MLKPMTPRTKKTAAALSGALVLASGAYALGSQAGDGSALAGQNANASRQAGGYGHGYGPGPGRRGPERDALTASDVHRLVDYRPITRYDLVGGYTNLAALTALD